MSKRKDKGCKSPQKLTQIFRNNPAIYLLLSGALLIVLINLLYMTFLPNNLKRLLKNPTDTETLLAVLLQVKDRQARVEFEKLLRDTGQGETLDRAASEKAKIWEKIKATELLLQRYPKYPDGYAYLSLLYEKMGSCDKAGKLINKAIELDRNRKQFVEIKHFLGKCD